ncbi:sensor histidine kinase [Pedobacter sp. N23S346]|uniref:sensor histidine kinase n=1 Tax=Pedobacter sp. N23S346 TaxID=3402750 RepID=UPI003ACE53A3
MYLFKKHKVFIYHICFWIFYIALGVLLKASRNSAYASNILENLLADILILNIPTFYGFYISWYAYSKFLVPLKTYKLILSLILIFISYVLVWYIVDYCILPKIGKDYIPTSEFKFWQFVLVIFYIFIECNTVAFGFQFFKKTLNHQRQLRVIQNEKLEIEYAFLRAQINPHFLNNTLNFFYAKSLPLSQELSDGIMTLSEIMRYSLQADQNNQLTLLIDEIEQIKNMIKINQLRFENSLNINLIVLGDIQNFLVVPLTLATILENILKHGDCTNKNAKAEIKLTIDNDILVVNAFNKKKNKHSIPLEGISLKNLRTRLKNYYGDGFKLIINDQELFYRVNLTIPKKN